MFGDPNVTDDRARLGSVRSLPAIQVGDQRAARAETASSMLEEIDKLTCQIAENTALLSDRIGGPCPKNPTEKTDADVGSLLLALRSHRGDLARILDDVQRVRGALGL